MSRRTLDGSQWPMFAGLRCLGVHRRLDAVARISALHLGTVCRSKSSPLGWAGSRRGRLVRWPACGHDRTAKARSLGRRILTALDPRRLWLRVRAVGFSEQIGSGSTCPSGQPDPLAFCKDLAVALGGATVVGSLTPMSVKASPIRTQVISGSALRAVQAQDVAEALDFTNGIRETVACGICGTNDLHINGLEGVYTLVLLDGIPAAWRPGFGLCVGRHSAEHGPAGRSRSRGRPVRGLAARLWAEWSTWCWRPLDAR